MEGLMLKQEMMNNTYDKENIPPFTSSTQLLSYPNGRFHRKCSKCRRFINNRIPLRDITHLFVSSPAQSSSSSRTRTIPVHNSTAVVDVPNFRKRKALLVEDLKCSRIVSKSLRMNFR
ncbi:hypothetical protein RND81_04G025100 [Saponaria officinalis]|uniref:Uncharacterized protein n=1 Tax=Saponaria officinalis TaxID=3572 RepID=A0AAW1LH15_SAPOF